MKRNTFGRLRYWLDLPQAPNRRTGVVASETQLERIELLWLSLAVGRNVGKVEMPLVVRRSLVRVGLHSRMS